MRAFFFDSDEPKLIKKLFVVALWFACSDAVAEASIDGAGIRASFREWASKISVSHEELLRLPSAPEVFHNPERYADDLIDCASSAKSNQMERLVCIMLIQKAQALLFHSSYDAMFKAWEAGTIPTREVVFILEQPIWAMNRLALQRERGELRAMFDRTLASERARTAEAQPLISLVWKHKVGIMRAMSHISMYWYEHDQEASFLVTPTTADNVSMLGGILDFLVINFWFVVVLLLLLVVTTTVYFSRRFRITKAARIGA